MRWISTALLLISGAGVAACTSSGGMSVDTILQRPSMEVTSSIDKGEADMLAPPAEVVAPKARIAPKARVASKSARVETALAEEPEIPDAVPVALLSPEKPARATKALRRAVLYPRQFRDAKPINFGRASPRSLAVHGVDVSRWQGNIDWRKLRSQGANFAYIKATDGGDHLDPMFRKNWQGAAAAGLKRGAYHFFYWCRAASEQADWFIRNVPRVPGALPPVIDVEYNHESSCKRRLSRARVLEKMQVFMDRLEAHYGQRPIIYTAPDFYRDNLRGAFPNHPFWLRSVAAHPSRVYPDRKWVFWQYSGSGLSHGVTGKIDLNVFNGNENDWYRWTGGASSEAEMASAD